MGKESPIDGSNEFWERATVGPQSRANGVQSGTLTWYLAVLLFMCPHTLFLSFFLKLLEGPIALMIWKTAQPLQCLTRLASLLSQMKCLLSNHKRGDMRVTLAFPWPLTPWCFDKVGTLSQLLTIGSEVTTCVFQVNGTEEISKVCINCCVLHVVGYQPETVEKP